MPGAALVPAPPGEAAKEKPLGAGAAADAAVAAGGAAAMPAAAKASSSAEIELGGAVEDAGAPGEARKAKPLDCGAVHLISAFEEPRNEKPVVGGAVGNEPPKVDPDAATCGPANRSSGSFWAEDTTGAACAPPPKLRRSPKGSEAIFSCYVENRLQTEECGDRTLHCQQNEEVEEVSSIAKINRTARSRSFALLQSRRSHNVSLCTDGEGAT